MIEICMNGAKFTMEKMRQFQASPTGIFLYVITTGVLGIVILLAFLAMLFGAAMLKPLLPMIVGFNCASGAYGCIEKGRPGQSNQLFFITSAALIMILAGCLIASLFHPWEQLFEGYTLLFTVCSGVISTLFGVWLGVKNRSLNKQDKQSSSPRGGNH